MKRRFALALLLASGMSGWLAATALGDPTSPVLSATISPPPASGPDTETVTLGALADCPTYSGPEIQEYARPPQQPGPVAPTPDEPGLEGTWALSAILQCMQPPITDYTAISVFGSDGSPQVGNGSELTPADLNPPGDFSFANEVPIVLFTGGVQYARPWRGGNDYNYYDVVTEPESAPLSVQVFEGAQLQVSANASNPNPTTQDTVNFTASVSPADPNNPQYAWSFEGGASPSNQQDPQGVQFRNPGTYYATVRVTDSAGAIGSATVPVTVSKPSGTPTPTKTGGNPQPGNGQHSGGGQSGPQNGHGHNPGPGTGNPQPQGSGNGGSQPGAGKGGTAPGAGAGATGPAGTPASSSRHRATPRGHRRGGTTRHTGRAAGQGGKATATGSVQGSAPIPSYPVPASAFKSPARPNPATPAHRVPRSPLRPPAAQSPSTHAPVISGRLISGLNPLPLAESPFVRTLAAPQPAPEPVREAVRTSALAAVGGVLAFLLLLGAGAARELIAGRGWRWLRLGT